MAFLNAGQFSTYTKAQMDSYIAGLAANYDGVLNQVHQFATFLNAHPDADFTAISTSPGPTGYAAGEIATIKSAFVSDGDFLFGVYTGANTLGVARDFRAFLKLLAVLTH